MGNFLDYLKKNELYTMGDSKIIIHVLKIEEDLQKKLNIDCIFTSASNGSLNLYYNVFSNMSFKKMRLIKKYFLDNIPHVTTVNFDDSGFTVQLTRMHGLDVLDANQY